MGYIPSKIYGPGVAAFSCCFRASSHSCAVIFNSFRSVFAYRQQRHIKFRNRILLRGIVRRRQCRRDGRADAVADAAHLRRLGDRRTVRRLFQNIPVGESLRPGKFAGREHPHPYVGDEVWRSRNADRDEPEAIFRRDGMQGGVRGASEALPVVFGKECGNEGRLSSASRHDRGHGVSAGCPDADYDARELLRIAAGKDPRLLFDPLTRPQAECLAELAAQRMQRVPLQYLAGEWDFLGLTFKVGPGVLCPRADSEVVCETAIELLQQMGKPGPRVLDLCAGTGCLGIGIRHFVPGVSVTCVEKSPQALQYLQANVHGTGVQAKAADVLQYWRELMPQSVQLIISNPPFHDGMQTSLDAAQTLIRGAVRHLNSGGELRIVANAFLPYPDVLDETFGFHEVIAQTGRFKVYRAIMTRQAKKG